MAVERRAAEKIRYRIQILKSYLALNETELMPKLRFPSFPRRRESSVLKITEPLVPRLRGDDEIKSSPLT